MQKLHIGEFYRKTVPPGTEDCEPDPGFNYDKANTFGEDLFKQARKLQDAQAEKLKSLQANKLTSW